MFKKINVKELHEQQQKIDAFIEQGKEEDHLMEYEEMCEQEEFVWTDDLSCKVGTLVLWCEHGEHGPYEATLPTNGGSVLEVRTDGDKIFTIRLTMNGTPFEEYVDTYFNYAWYKDQVKWDRDFDNGWLDFRDPVEFHRVVTGLWGIMGPIYGRHQK